MKLAELLYQNRDKFTLHPDCKWIAQDKGYQVYQYSGKPVINDGDSDYLSYGGLCKPFLCEGDGIMLSSDWRSPLSREEYEQYCKEQDAKFIGDIDNALIKFKPFVSVEDNQGNNGPIKSIEAALAEMPKPQGKGNPILGMVLSDLTNRAFEGVKKYGEPLKADNGRDALVDAYQEALDLCMYLRQAIEERNNG